MIKDQELVKKHEDLKYSLKTNSSIRTENQIHKIMSYMSSLSFFKNIIIPMGDDVMHKVCGVMDYECFDQDQFICNKGELGGKFYVILKGIVKVLVSSTINDISEYETCQLKEGVGFGEFSLLHNQPRIASIQCLTKTEVATLTKENYLNIIGKAESKRMEDQIRFLKSFSIFKKWSKGNIMKISYFFKEKTYTRKTVIFHEGDNANEIILIKTGELEISKSIQTPTKNRISLMRTFSRPQSANLALLGPGQMVGDEILNSDKHLYTCTVYSLSATILVMNKKDFIAHVTSEDIQDLLISENETKEKIRNFRMRSLIKIQNSYSPEVEGKFDKRFEKESMVKGKNVVNTQTCNSIFIKKDSRFKRVGKVDVKQIASKARINLFTSVSNSFLHINLRKHISPLCSRISEKTLEQSFSSPLKIEQKRILSREGLFKLRKRSPECEWIKKSVKH
ncbi:hypothetical protein SteCoe_34895 [Stentor coeruleus]|uniref:Cyclic nucleotide-binding domain-containing protein n=1 Tax=Stentor coeruleus TaxID=5963 RepID=A0A1R2ATL3_9CILI|nr:hypothetical protein SteCoe_34895 [Stentor coeruleus]